MGVPHTMMIIFGGPWHLTAWILCTCIYSTSSATSSGAFQDTQVIPLTVPCVNPHRCQVGANLWCWDWASHGLLHHQPPSNTSHRLGSSPDPFYEKIIIIYVRASVLDNNKPSSLAKSQFLPVLDCPGTTSGRHWPLTRSFSLTECFMRACKIA